MYKKEVSDKMYFYVGIQIVLMISMTFAFSFIFNQAMSNTNEVTVKNTDSLNSESILLNILKIFDNMIFGNNNFVSALDNSDLQNGVYTCPVDNNGSICQDYPASACATNCASGCVPTTPNETSGCQLGTCYDPTQGTCESNSPKTQCTNNGGKWFSDPKGNVAQCQQGCCSLGDSTFLGTSQQCSEQASVTGLVSSFNPQINTEIGCLALQQNQVQGACVEENSNSGLNL